MANEFRLPDIGEGLTDAEIVEWQVKVGDDVAVDQALVEMETAKAVVEITAPFAGVVLHLGGGEGDTVNVGDVLFVVGDEGEEWEPVASPQFPVPNKNNERTEPAATTGGAVKAMPVVRKLAKERGVDLATLTGTGPGGAITRDDVLAATATGAVVNDREERVQMSRMRRTIAANLTRSWQEIPHVTAQAEVDAGNLLEVHRTFKEKGPFPLEALIARAALPLL
ncbi:MAG: E3 binding domain-containing protein, partial [Actinobacteria bacterium]|nr:E3 binding domain-containing protein [Actinomycetota bacterium]